MKFSCTCGKQLEAPETAAGTRGRCPGCGKVITVPQPGQSQAALAKGAPAPATDAPSADSAVGQTCTVCQTTIGAGEPVSFCPECRLPYHADCWTENGGCATYGCDQAPKTVKPAEPQADEVARRGWGDTKKCPYCGETIRAAALKCKFCHEVFETADPITREDLRRKQVSKQRRGQDSTKAIIFFILSVLSCMAPILALVGAYWIFGDRKGFKEMDMTNRVLVGAGFALSCLISVIMLLGLVLAALES
jgi:hypothetical protein